MQFLNITDSKFQEVGSKSFILNKLESLDVRRSIFPIQKNSFTGSNLQQISLSDLDVDIEYLHELKTLTNITFNNCTLSLLNAGVFADFSSLQYLTFKSCQIMKIDPKAFDSLMNIEYLTIAECNIDYINFDSFLQLTSLKSLTFYGNKLNCDANYDVFKRLTALEEILFDLDVYKQTDFSEYPNLKTVCLSENNEESNNGKEERNKIISNLKKLNINYQLVLTGTIEVNMDEMEVCC